MRAYFIHDPADLDSPVPGGVQLCSREFLQIVSAAAEEVRLLPVHVATALPLRLRRKLGLGSYLLYDPETLAPVLAREAAAFRPSHIFLNRAELLRLAPVIARILPEARVVLLSHGNQSGDDLYEAAGPAGLRAAGLARFAAAWRLGRDLVTESAFRHRHLFAVCVMTPEEEVLERWLGARRTVVLPRLAPARPLDWRPVPGRVGFVGTLDHTPNRVALRDLLRELAPLAPPGLELRLAGGPAGEGARLASPYPFVTYIGRPDDDALAAEAATWSLFLNPVFWLSRGASMKLGQSLSWALPALSTRAGARGYATSPDQTVLVSDSAPAFARELVRLAADLPRLESLRAGLLAASRPDAPALGARLREALAD